MSDIACNSCNALLDTSDIEPFSECECPECGANIVIPYHFGNLVLKESIERYGVFDIYSGCTSDDEKDTYIYILNNEIKDYEDTLKLAEETAKQFAELNNHYLNKTIGFGVENDRFYVTEAIPDGYDMSSYDPATAEEPLNFENVVEIMKSVGLGLATLHHKEIAHHDICPENIHIDDKGNVKLKKLFISSFTYKYNVLKNLPHEVSPYFISPEKLEKGTEEKPGDAFSYAAVAYFLLTGKYPFIGRNEIETKYCRLKKGNGFQPGKADKIPESPDEVKYKIPEMPKKLREEINDEINNTLLSAFKYEIGVRPNIPQILDAFTMYQANKDKEEGIAAAQKKMVLTETVIIPGDKLKKKKKKGFLGIFGL